MRCCAHWENGLFFGDYSRHCHDCPHGQSISIEPVNRRADQPIESFGILNHQEMPDPRHEDHLNTMVLEGSYVGRSVVRIDCDHWLGAVAPRSAAPRGYSCTPTPATANGHSEGRRTWRARLFPPGQGRIGYEHASNEVASRLCEVWAKFRCKCLDFFRGSACPQQPA